MNKDPCLAMAYDEQLEKRIVSAWGLFPAHVSDQLQTKKMFGGLAFLYKGKMTVGIIKDELIVRVIEDKMDQVLKLPAVRPMDFTKRPMKEFIYVSPAGFESEEALQHWLELGLEHAKTKVA